MSGRGMMKWAPYKSLVEQATCLEDMRYKKNKIEKPIISEDKAEEINEILTNYNGETLEITFFNRGFLYQVDAIIQKIDIYEKQLITENGRISINNVIDLKIK